MRQAGRIVAAIASAQAAIAAIVLIVLMLHIIADVVGRYAFDAPVPGTLEIVAAYYMVVVVFFSYAYIERRHGHIRVEIFTRFLPAAVNLWLDLFNYAVFVAVSAAFTFLTFQEAATRTGSNEMWPTADGMVAVWPSRWLVPLGMGVLCCCALARALQIGAEIGRGRPVTGAQ